MNLSAVQATLARLREAAGPEGVQTHPEFGWFGFLDLPLASPRAPRPTGHNLACSTPQWSHKSHLRLRAYSKHKQRDSQSFQGFVSSLALRHGKSQVKRWLLQELRRS